MKTRGRYLTILCLAILFAAVQSGCRKKTQEPTDNPEQPVPPVQNVDAQPALDVEQQFQNDLNSTDEETTAAAGKMSANDLRKMAEKYRDVIAANEQKLEALTKEFIAIPAAEKISLDAQSLQATMDKLHSDLPKSKARFAIYCNALKEKNGNLAGLDI